MKSLQESVTVAIATFNEEDNIVDCVNSILDCGFKFIQIYDGGSTDSTRKIVEREFSSVKFNSIEVSLSTRRKMAIENCQTEYLFFVDADQRLLQHDYMKIVYENFNDGVAGIQFLKVLPESEASSYWQRGFAVRNRIVANDASRKKVIGTPCIYKSKLLKESNYSEKIIGAADDTLVGHELNDKGYHFVSVEATAVEIFRPSAKATARKAFWYGLGDAEFVRNSSVRSARRNHLFHVLIRNPIIFPMKALPKKFVFVPFLLFFGGVRLVGFLTGSLNAKAQLKKS